MLPPLSDLTLFYGMHQGTKEMGDQKASGCKIWVEPTRDVSSGDETSLHLRKNSAGAVRYNFIIDSTHCWVPEAI
jgi:hypothetical protein